MKCEGHPRLWVDHDPLELEPGPDGIAVCPTCDFAWIECGMPGCHNGAEHWEIAVPSGTIKVSPEGSLLTPYEATPVCSQCCPRVASGEKPDGIVAVTPISLIYNVEEI